MAIHDNQWHPGIGDPTFIGWLTVAAYAWTAWSAWRTWRQEKSGTDQPRQTRHSEFWALLLIAMVLLGINKQLDLQSWFTQILRTMAQQQGWYEDRQRFQIAFIVGLGTLCVIGLLVCWRAFAVPFQGGIKTAFAGLLLLTSFVLIRASSFHHVDAWLGMHWGPMRWNHVLELGALGVIAWGTHQGRMFASDQHHQTLRM